MKMSDFTIFCTAEQTKRAYELGAPIEANKAFSKGVDMPSTICVYGDIKNKDQWGVGECIVLHTPTTQQMIGWLRTQGIAYHFGETAQSEKAIIDAALDYLEERKKK